MTCAKSGCSTKPVGGSDRCSRHASKVKVGGDWGKLLLPRKQTKKTKRGMNSSVLSRRKSRAVVLSQYEVSGEHFPIAPTSLPDVAREEHGRTFFEYEGAALTELYRTVGDQLRENLEWVHKVDCYAPAWVGDVPLREKRSFVQRGTIHRDVHKSCRGHYTALCFYDSFKSGGIRIWENTEEYGVGLTLSGKNVRRYLNRHYSVKDELPQRYHVLVFDGRLLHQSLPHLDPDKYRIALSFQIAVNGTAIRERANDLESLCAENFA